MERPSFHPNLTGKVTPEAKQAIDYLFDQVLRVNKSLAATDQVARAAARPEQIGPEASRQLNIGGAHPLNIEGLLGVLAQPQKANATPVNALPGPQDPLSQAGQIVYFNHRLYWFDASTDPGVWRLLGQTVIIDTHAVRLSSYPAVDNPFVFFYETDRTVLYVSDGTNWYYVAGEMYGTFSPLQRPTDLTSHDITFPFHCTDLGKTYTWSGTIWNCRTEIATALYDTHSYRTFDGTVDVTGGVNVARVTGALFSATWIGMKVMVGGAIRVVATVPTNATLTLGSATTNGAGQIFNLYEYASVNYAKGTMFFESDRTVYYSVRDITLTVTVAGTTNVTVTTGRVLDNRWIGAVVDVGGVSSTILSVTSSTTAVLASAVGNGAGQIMTVYNGIWQYASGQYVDTLANIPTGFLADDYGFIFYSTDYEHSYRWSFFSGSFVWRYAPGDGGSNYLVAAQSSAPDGGYWGKCNGSTYTRSTGAGGTTSVVTKDLTNADFIKAGDSAHTAAVAPTFQGGARTEDTTAVISTGGITGDAGLHAHDVEVVGDSADFTAGGDSYAFPGDYGTSDDGTHSHTVDASTAPQDPHHHDISNTHAHLNTDGQPASVGLDWYVRL